MESLMNISAIGFRVCIAMTVLGLLLTAYTYRRFDIRSIYMIRSGRARRKTVSELQARNNETGRLSADMTSESAPDTGGSKTVGKTFGRRKGKTEKTDDASPFKRKKHTGKTETFISTTPEVLPRAEMMPHHAPAPAQPAQEAIPDTTLLEQTRQYDAYATTQLNKADIEAALAARSEESMGHAGNSMNYASSVYAEPRAPLEMISSEVIIHTDEVIDL